MSGLVSYDLFKSRLGIGNCGFTLEGGIYEMFINNTGTSIKGTIVIASESINNAVDIAPANSENAIGIIYESGIPKGGLVKVVVFGKAQVLIKDGEESNSGYWCGVSNEKGRMYQLTGAPSPTLNKKKIGSSLESKASGKNMLALIQLNFN